MAFLPGCFHACAQHFTAGRIIQYETYNLSFPKYTTRREEFSKFKNVFAYRKRCKEAQLAIIPIRPFQATHLTEPFSWFWKQSR
jgi:hypothetical protein